VRFLVNKFCVLLSSLVLFADNSCFLILAMNFFYLDVEAFVKALKEDTKNKDGDKKDEDMSVD